MCSGDFSGGPVVKTLSFHCRGHRFDPCWGARIPHAVHCGKKKKKNGSGCLFFCYHSLLELYILHISIMCYVAIIFDGLSLFNFAYYLLCIKLLTFYVISFAYFVFYDRYFCLTLPYPPQQYKDILLYLHVIFIFLIFIFSSLKHLEFIFAYGMKQGSSYFIF